MLNLTPLRSLPTGIRRTLYSRIVGGRSGDQWIVVGGVRLESDETIVDLHFDQAPVAPLWNAAVKGGNADVRVQFAVRINGHLVVIAEGPVTPAVREQVRLETRCLQRHRRNQRKLTLPEGEPAYPWKERTLLRCAA